MSAGIVRLRRLVSRVLAAVSWRCRQLARWADPSPQPDRVSAYRAAGGDAAHRLAAPVPSGGLVVDVGAYEGDYAAEMVARNPGIEVLAFEPVERFAAAAAERFARNPAVTVEATGVAAAAGRRTLHLADDATSTRTGRGPTSAATFVSVAQMWEQVRQRGHERVCVLKLNIEGDEYDVLEQMNALGLLPLVDRLDVQFHDFVAGAETRRDAVRRHLARTHRLVYDFPFVWEGWQLRDEGS